MNRTPFTTARTAPCATAVATLAALLALGGTAAMAQTVHIVEPAAPRVQVMPAATVQVMPAPTIVAPSTGLARVVSATPNIERYVETRQQCTDQVQQVTTPGTAGLGSTIAGSLIGGIRETQEMLDFCAEHGLASDIEVIAPDQINEAYARLEKSDVRYRFVLDMARI